MRKKIIFLGVLTIFLTISVITSNINFNSLRSNQVLNETIENNGNSILTIKSAGFWSNFSYIHITGSNWTIAASYEWCRGSGTWSDPYIIENMTIDASSSPTGSGILIENSKNVYFIIRNVTVYNSGTTWLDGGIILSNTNNGTLLGNNASSNYIGINLINSNNNTISQNVVSKCEMGILLRESDENHISKNNITENSGLGIYILGIESFFTNYNNTLDDNDVTGGGIGISGTKQELLSNNITVTNVICNKPVYYYVNKSSLKIENFTNAGQIILAYANNSFIENQNISKAANGISLRYCSNITIKNNSINDNNYEGIFLYESSMNNILENTINNNRYGIFLNINSYNNSISNNNLTNNRETAITIQDSYNNSIYNNQMKNSGITLEPGDQDKLSNKIYVSNTLNEKIIYFYENKLDLKMNNFSNAGQVILLNCNNSEIFNLNLSKGSTSIALYYSNNNTIMNNNASFNTKSGIFFHISDKNNISNNDFSNNDEYGAYISSSLSNNNIFSNNTFQNNGDNAIDPAANNQWDNGSLGNFWDDYLGKDADDDGIGDPGYPYNIPGGGGAQDNYPIFWDAPIISVKSPADYSAFSFTAPFFNISIDEGLNDTLWYSFLAMPQPFESNFTGNYFQVNQTGWDNALIVNSSVFITFYVNDSRGYIGSAISNVIKDIMAPMISILDPAETDLFGMSPPAYNISLLEGFLDEVWYIVGNNDTMHFITGSFSGTFNSTTWLGEGDGNVTIRFYANDTAGNMGNENVTVEKDTLAPQITVRGPEIDSVYSSTPPSYNLTILEAHEFNLTIRLLNMTNQWVLHSLDNIVGGGTPGYIDEQLNQTFWDSLSDGLYSFEFYAIDQVWNARLIQFITFVKDSVAPSIIINSPQINQAFNETAPAFNVFITDIQLNTTWYRMWNGTTWSNNFIFTTNQTVNQTYWDYCADGVISLYFYANDSAENLNITIVSIIKDTTAPIVSVSSPTNNADLTRNAPTFSLTITELSLDTIWYRIWDGSSWSDNFTAPSSSGTINKDLWEGVWDSLSHGNLLKIEFFANDTLGRVGSDLVQVKKYDPPSPPNGFDLIIWFIIIGTIGAVALIGIIIKIKKGGSKSLKDEKDRIKGIIDLK